MDKRGKTNWTVIALVALVLIVFNIGGIGDIVTGFFSSLGLGGGATDGDRDDEEPTVCIHEPVMTIGPMYKAFTDTALTGEYAQVYINGVNRGKKADGSTIATKKGAEVDIYYGINSSSYYASKHSFVVPCEPAFTTAELQQNSENYLYETDGSTHLNMKMFNEDDGLLNEGMGGATGNNETLAAGDSIDIEGSIQGNFEDAFSPYGEMMLSVKYNTSAFDVWELTSTTAGYDASAATASVFRSNLASATGFSLKSWEVSKGLISSNKFSFAVHIEADDTYAPVTGTVGATWYVDDKDYWVDDSNKVQFGYEDTDDNTDVGETTDNTKNWGYK